MSLLELADQNCIITHLQSLDKQSVIEELLDILVKQKKVKDRSLALKDVMDREAKGSTGLEKGIAVPHGKTAAVDTLSLAIGISREGVDFTAMDGKYSHLIFLLLAPPGSAGPHVEALAEIARFLTPARVREKLLTVDKPEDVINIIVEYENS